MMMSLKRATRMLPTLTMEKRRTTRFRYSMWVMFCIRNDIRAACPASSAISHSLNGYMHQFALLMLSACIPNSLPARQTHRSILQVLRLRLPDSSIEQRSLGHRRERPCWTIMTECLLNRLASAPLYRYQLLPMSKFIALPDDILLLICRPRYMPWHTALSLTFVHPRFRSLIFLKNRTEEDWRLLLYRYGLSRSLLDSRAGRTWKELAWAIAYYSGRCRLCEQYLRPSSRLGGRSRYGGGCVIWMRG